MIFLGIIRVEFPRNQFLVHVLVRVVVLLGVIWIYQKEIISLEELGINITALAGALAGDLAPQHGVIVPLSRVCACIQFTHTPTASREGSAQSSFPRLKIYFNCSTTASRKFGYRVMRSSLQNLDFVNLSLYRNFLMILEGFCSKR